MEPPILNRVAKAPFMRNGLNLWDWAEMSVTPFRLFGNAARPGGLARGAARFSSHRRHAAVSALALSGLLLATSVGSAAASSGPDEKLAENPEVVKVDTVTNSAVDAALRVGAAAEQASTSTFGGVFLTDNGSHLNIYITEPNLAEKQRLVDASGLETDQISFVEAEHSWADLNRVQEDLTSDFSTLTAAGLDIRSWAVYPAENAIKVEVAESNAGQHRSADLFASYGSLVEVESVPEVETSMLMDRHNDFAAWNGGSFITDNKTGDCTSGVPVHDGLGTKYLLTAEHCFSLGARVYNKSALIPRGTGNFIGVVSNVLGGNRGIDAALINTNSSKLIFTGYTTGATTANISGFVGSPAGAKVCHSGAFEGEICGFSVDANGCNTFNGGKTYCNLLHASGTNPQAVGEGDSGGPVFTRTGSTVRASGIVTGGTHSTGMVQCNNWYPQWTGRLCGSGLWYTDIYAPVNAWTLYDN